MISEKTQISVVQDFHKTIKNYEELIEKEENPDIKKLLEKYYARLLLKWKETDEFFEKLINFSYEYQVTKARITAGIPEEKLSLPIKE